ARPQAANTVLAGREFRQRRRGTGSVWCSPSPLLNRPQSRRVSMPTDGRRDLPKGITPKLRTQGTERVPVTAAAGIPVYRVRLFDPVLKRQIERAAEGLDAAEKLLGAVHEAKRRPGGRPAEHVGVAGRAAP